MKIDLVFKTYGKNRIMFSRVVFIGGFTLVKSIFIHALWALDYHVFLPLAHSYHVPKVRRL